MIVWIIILLICIGLFIRVKKRGYFWKDKQGNKLSFKEFMKRWKEGAEGTTPLQATRITLWSFIPIFAGIIWGIVITFMAKTYWMTLILCGSLPITSVQFISAWQKYKRLKVIEKEMEKLK